MNILVTGGCGFIGAYTTRDLLRAGHRVTVIDTAPRSLLDDLLVEDDRALLTSVIPLDVTDVASLVRLCKAEGIEGIVHLAAMLGDACEQFPLRAAQVNVIGMAALFEVASLLSIPRIVWSSSISVFGYVESDRHLGDAARHDPSGFYGVYKSANEAQARLYHRNFGVNSIGLRVGFAYGYGRSRGSGSWIRELIELPALGHPGKVDGGDVLVPWLYVEDISSAMVSALQSDIGGSTVLNMRGEPRRKSEAADFVRSMLPDADIVIVGNPSGYATGVDDSELRRLLKWSPQYSMEEGIEKTIRLYREIGGRSGIRELR